MDDMYEEIMERLNGQRTRLGFLTVEQVLKLADRHNTVLDPFSTLISEGIQIGSGNVFYPNVILDARNSGSISVGDGNVFHGGTLFVADGTWITVGNGNEFGDGGVRIKANRPGDSITVGNEGRYMNGAEIMGSTTLGSGTQVLGPITVQNCRLEAGDSYRGGDPCSRGGLLKGFGLARNLTIKRGEVMNGQGTFDQSHVESQSVYHRKGT